MDFSLNEEQRLLADSVERFVRGSYPIELRRRIVHEQGGFNPDIWRQFADLGWLMLPFDEADGG
ncbi:MAG: acyl-CoA dehydrogenase family protein, partial [Perlucidibaca sp.]